MHLPRAAIPGHKAEAKEARRGAAAFQEGRPGNAIHLEERV
jgi:hypothetical protein